MRGVKSGCVADTGFAGVSLALSPFFYTNAFQRAVHLCFGAVTHSDNNARTFALDPEQWTNAFNDYAKVQATKNSAAAPKAPLKSVFPVIGFFPETTRYKKKPVPWVKQYVSFGGYLSGMASSLEGETMQERFCVEVDNIAFLGTYTPLASTPSPTLTASTSGAYGEQFFRLIFCQHLIPILEFKALPPVRRRPASVTPSSVRSAAMMMTAPMVQLPPRPRRPRRPPRPKYIRQT
jgi:hypothetical protein